jgi:hypothetical protein
LSAAGEVLQVSRFRVNSVGSAMTGARPGGNDWGPVYGSSLSVQLSYTAAWHALSAGNKVTTSSWAEVKGKALEAFEALNYAQAKADVGGTVAEWQEVFGPSFSIDA